MTSPADDVGERAREAKPMSCTSRSMLAHCHVVSGIRASSLRARRPASALPLAERLPASHPLCVLLTIFGTSWLPATAAAC